MITKANALERIGRHADDKRRTQAGEAQATHQLVDAIVDAHRTHGCTLEETAAAAGLPHTTVLAMLSTRLGL